MTDRVIRFKYFRKGGRNPSTRLPDVHLPPGDYEVEVLMLVTRLPEKRRRPVSGATRR